jgi:hypothetical protein
MEGEKFEPVTNNISRGDISFAEDLFSKPGGRKYLENILMVLLTSLPEQGDKDDLFVALVKGLDKIEKRIKRQKEGKEILQQVYNK